MSFSRFSAMAKLVLDVVVAFVLLVVLIPLFLLIIVLIELESPGSPFYRATRVGYRGKPLQLLKFRKMRLDARGLPLTVGQDERLTRVGAFLTRTRLDELPQLWHIVRGQMSLVGPRPEDPLFVEMHREAYEHILCVRPGITGWSQLAYAGESALLDPADPIGHYIERILPVKVQLDCKYAERTRLWHDLRVLWWTVVALLPRMQVAVHRSTGDLSRRRPRTIVYTMTSPSSSPGGADTVSASAGRR